MDEKDLWWVPLVIAIVGVAGTIAAAFVNNRTDPRLVRTISAITDLIAKMSAEDKPATDAISRLSTSREVLVGRLESRIDRRVLRAVGISIPAILGVATAVSGVVVTVNSAIGGDAAAISSGAGLLVGAVLGIVAGLIAALIDRVRARKS